MGVEFGTNIINVNNNIVKLHIWDTVLLFYICRLDKNHFHLWLDHIIESMK